MLQRPVAAGVACGLLTWVAMNHVVVPLSRASPSSFVPAWFVDGLLAHVLLVGFVFAFVARWSARRAKSYS
jgi:predicted Co/Zn/Cd cation transporter (cation efflux family)